MNVSFGTLPRAWQSEDGEDGGKERFIFTEYIEQTTHHSNVSPERERKGKAEKNPIGSTKKMKSLMDFS